jgi:hypothetical protein
MSLYNQLFGYNPYAPVLLAALGVSPSDAHKIPRFRDIYLDTDGSIIILTRTGGVRNREQYAAENTRIRDYLPGYLRDEDDSFDSTFARFYYARPECLTQETVDLILSEQGVRGVDLFKQLNADLASGADTPLARRGLEVGAEILKKLDLTSNKPGVHIIEVDDDT